MKRGFMYFVVSKLHRLFPHFVKKKTRISLALAYVYFSTAAVENFSLLKKTWLYVTMSTSELQTLDKMTEITTLSDPFCQSPLGLAAPPRPPQGLGNSQHELS
jgi:hypothetical protein